MTSKMYTVQLRLKHAEMDKFNLESQAIASCCKWGEVRLDTGHRSGSFTVIVCERNINLYKHRDLLLDIGKQCKTTLDAAKYGVGSGSTLFACRGVF